MGRTGILLVTLGWLGGCEDLVALSPGDAGTGAGLIDAGFIDAGSIDAGFIDAGFIDAGFIDAGFIDAGVADAGFFNRPDAGDDDLPDAGRNCEFPDNPIQEFVCEGDEDVCDPTEDPIGHVGELPPEIIDPECDLVALWSRFEGEHFVIDMRTRAAPLRNVIALRARVVFASSDQGRDISISPQICVSGRDGEGGKQ